MCARLSKWLVVTHPLPNAPTPNPKQPVVDPKDIHGSLTVANIVCSVVNTDVVNEEAPSSTVIQSHELYIKFQARKSRRSQVHLWKPVLRALVLEQCVLSASP